MKRTRDRLKTKGFIRKIQIWSAEVGRIGDLEKIEEMPMRAILKELNAEAGKKDDPGRIGERKLSWCTKDLSEEAD
jgi:hypothetical protein